MALNEVHGYIGGHKGTYGAFLDLSTHGVPRAVFDLIPVKEQAKAVEGKPFWRKDWSVRRNGSKMELSFFCDEPPSALEVNGGDGAFKSGKSPKSGGSPPGGR